MAPLFVLLLLRLALGSPTCPSVLPQPQAHARIIGGTAAIPATRAFLVSISNPADVFACTGSLLSPRWVLTAAHCKVRPDWNLRVAPTRATTGPTVPIRRVYQHEDYSDNPNRPDGMGDIALVELAEDAPANASFVRLNIDAADPVKGSFARAAGYGNTRTPGQDRNNSLPFQVDGPVNSAVKCSKIYKGYLNVKKDLFICVGYGKDYCVADSCHGDSGGPLFQLDKNHRPVQVGVVSFGLECGMKGVPGVHVRVSSFIGWIQKKGAVFETSGSAEAVFAEGSEDAASDEASVTVVQLLGEDEKPEEDSSQLKISKATFVVICVVAAIALVGFMFLAFFFVSARRNANSADSDSPLQVNFPDEERQTPPSSSGHLVNGQQAHENLRTAISLLQANNYGQAQGNRHPSLSGSRENLAIDQSQRDNSRQRSLPSSGSLYWDSTGPDVS